MKNTSLNSKVLFLIVTMLILLQTVLAGYDANYTSGNLTIISVDLIGTAMVELKPFIPMIIIGFAVLIVVTSIFKSLRKLDEV